MRKLGPIGKQWLKSLHLTLSLMWLGGVVCMNLLRWVWNPSVVGGLYALDHTIRLIDQVVVYPTAVGALVTGLLESWLTTWGFFKFRWVILKLVVTIAVILYGIVFQGAWLSELETVARGEGLAALHNPIYLRVRLLDTISAVVMISALATLPFVSVLKPWAKRDKLQQLKRRTSSASRSLPTPTLGAIESD
jgi:hypothetical protein